MLVGLALIFIFISLALGGAVNDDENPIVMLFGILGLLSFLITPFVFILACIADTPRHGLPNFSSSQRVKRNQGEDTWDRWIKEDKEKKRNSYKVQMNKADYLKKRREIKEQEQKEIKDKIAKYKAESKKKYLKELRQQELEKKKQIKLKEKELKEKDKLIKRRLDVKEKGINNPSFNLFKKEEFRLHKQRLEKLKKSKWKNVMYYKGSKGGIYTVNEKGTRNYKY